MNKSIWILNHYAIPPEMSGGTRHYDLGRELIKKGNKVLIFSSGFNHFNKEYNFHFKKKNNYIVKEYNKVKFVWLKTFSYKRNNIRRVINMISYGFLVLKESRNFLKPEVIVGSSMHPIAVLAAWWLARKYKAKFIFEVRDLWPQTAIDMKKLSKHSLIAKILFFWEKFMYSKADKVIVLLPYADEYITKKGIDRKKIVWISNGVNLDYFNEEALNNNISLEAENIFENIQKKFKVIYTGAHGIANGIEVILEAAKLLNKKDDNIHFLLFGDGTEKNRFAEEARALDLKNISFCNAVSKQMIPSILSHADCLIIQMLEREARRYGVSQNKLFDYLASGKPIILAGIPPNNLIEEAEAGITIKPGDANSLAKGILRIRGVNKEQRERMGINGKNIVRKYYDIKKLGNLLEEVIQNLILI